MVALVADVEVTREGAILTITLNRPDVLNALNRAMHAGLFAALEEAKDATMAVIARPDELLSGMELEAIVERSIADLEPEFREVLILRDVEDLSYEEIGDITGLADGTVKSRIHRARIQLKEAVELALGEKIG